jgi:hypothetical protein
VAPASQTLIFMDTTGSNQVGQFGRLLKAISRPGNYFKVGGSRLTELAVRTRQQPFPVNFII